ncbi:MAG: hypothetical protein ACPGJS_00190 [Flammeovirgaceae bacterium]
MQNLKSFTLILSILSITFFSSCDDDCNHDLLDDEIEEIDCNSSAFEKQDFFVNLSINEQFRTQNYPNQECYDYVNTYHSNYTSWGCPGPNKEYYSFGRDMSISDEELGRITLTFRKALLRENIDFNEEDWRLKSLFQGEVKFVQEKSLYEPAQCTHDDDNSYDLLLSDDLPTIIEVSYYDGQNPTLSSAYIDQAADAHFTVDQFELVEFEEKIPEGSSLPHFEFNGIISGTFSCKLVPASYCASSDADKVRDLKDIQFRMPIRVVHVDALPPLCD